MWNAFALAAQLLTILPVTFQTAPNRLTAQRSVIFFPLIGALSGVALAAAWLLAFRFWPHQILVAASLTLASGALLSGGRFLGGVGAAADGLAAYGDGGDRTRPFAVMRDPRRGAAGLVALGVTIAVKTAFLAGLTPGAVWSSLIVAMTLGRWASAFALSAFPLASATSYDVETGRGLSDSGPNEFLLATVMTILCLIVLPARGLLVMLIVAALFAPLAQAVQRRLGGINWALSCALGELAEIIALACLTVSLG